MQSQILNQHIRESRVEKSPCLPRVFRAIESDVSTYENRHSALWINLNRVHRDIRQASANVTPIKTTIVRPEDMTLCFATAKSNEDSVFVRRIDKNVADIANHRSCTFRRTPRLTYKIKTK